MYGELEIVQAQTFSLQNKCMHFYPFIPSDNFSWEAILFT